MALQNVEVIQQEAHKKTWFQRFRKSAKYSLVVPTMLAVNAYADTPAAPETTSIITYIGLVVIAVGAVGAAWIMVPLAAKGIKALVRAF
ncbi:hypothetical protein ACG9YY_04705 [Acinetobacter pittii]|uniref:hypothetical protein n=1 Tax=Acinetobacter pittii TaxID=48296 RepID=UPI001ABFD866|nr:hypothetical protein [Acinetobacter pittii]MDB0115725.1 hypothetical protein [Acinetobacter baumannii]QDB81965.1 hypothetical protein APMS7_06025 [Acinetobacter pittii]